jgi:OHCU decarboxylase
MTLAEFNTLADARAEELLRQCCGSKRWAHQMAGYRPFQSVDELHKTAVDLWWTLREDDWLEAFAQHPRIGERRTSGWASEEQSGTKEATAKLLNELAEKNAAYEKKFGHVYLVFATGKSASEMLTILDQRMDNDAKTELRVAAGEQVKITKLRLERLLSDSLQPSNA